MDDVPQSRESGPPDDDDGPSVLPFDDYPDAQAECERGEEATGGQQPASSEAEDCAALAAGVASLRRGLMGAVDELRACASSVAALGARVRALEQAQQQRDVASALAADRERRDAAAARVGDEVRALGGRVGEALAAERAESERRAEQIEAELHALRQRVAQALAQGGTRRQQGEGRGGGGAEAVGEELHELRKRVAQAHGAGRARAAEVEERLARLERSEERLERLERLEGSEERLARLEKSEERLARLEGSEERLARLERSEERLARLERSDERSGERLARLEGSEERLARLEGSEERLARLERSEARREEEARAVCEGVDSVECRVAALEAAARQDSGANANGPRSLADRVAALEAAAAARSPSCGTTSRGGNRNSPADAAAAAAAAKLEVPAASMISDLDAEALLAQVELLTRRVARVEGAGGQSGQQGTAVLNRSQASAAMPGPAQDAQAIERVQCDIAEVRADLEAACAECASHRRRIAQALEAHLQEQAQQRQQSQSAQSAADDTELQKLALLVQSIGAQLRAVQSVAGRASEDSRELRAAYESHPSADDFAAVKNGLADLRRRTALSLIELRKALESGRGLAAAKDHERTASQVRDVAEELRVARDEVHELRKRVAQSVVQLRQDVARLKSAPTTTTAATLQLQAAPAAATRREPEKRATPRRAQSGPSGSVPELPKIPEQALRLPHCRLTCSTLAQGPSKLRR
eukprot:m51a1_g1781 hypothetical protein (712) ;mRNA; r:343390-345672